MPPVAHPGSPRHGPPYDVAPDDPRLPQLRARLARRLAGVLAALPPEVAARTLDDIAHFELRWHDGHADADEDAKGREREPDRPGTSSPSPADPARWAAAPRPVTPGSA